MIRVGQGFDVHPFEKGRSLTLAGIRIGEGPGLSGHSDADVVLHAVTDALLGAIGAGDIGMYFPSTEERWRNAASSVFVHHALDLLRQRNAVLSNVDVTIIAERPRLAPYREQIASALSKLLQIPAGQVNVKATTTDHLGFIGRGEGICVLAIVAVEVGAS